jgi:hypothetical protein
MACLMANARTSKKCQSSANAIGDRRSSTAYPSGRLRRGRDSTARIYGHGDGHLIIAPRQRCNEICSNSPGRNINGGLARQRQFNAFNRTTAAFLGIRARLICFLPGIDIEPGERGKGRGSPVPFRASPIDALRIRGTPTKSGDSAAWSYHYPILSFFSATPSHARAVANAL